MDFHKTGLYWGLCGSDTLTVELLLRAQYSALSHLRYPISGWSFLRLGCSASQSRASYSLVPLAFRGADSHNPVLVRSGAHAIVLGTSKTHISCICPNNWKNYPFNVGQVLVGNTTVLPLLYMDKWSTQHFCDLPWVKDHLKGGYYTQTY